VLTTSLAQLAGVVRLLDGHLAANKAQLAALVGSWMPELLTEFGVGPVAAAQLLVSWSHPERCRSAAAFAMLAGTTPLQAAPTPAPNPNRRCRVAGPVDGDQPRETAALRTGRFPLDEPLENTARLAAQRTVTAVRSPERTLSDTTLRTTQTAQALGLHPTTEPAVADLDLGAWAGTPLGDLPGDQLAAWTTDPSATPHGGESVRDLLDRVGAWLRTAAVLPGRTVVVTHPAVVRAVLLTALQALPESFWRIDVPPLPSTSLHARGDRWTLRHACLTL